MDPLYFAIFDSKVGAYTPPQLYRSEGDAIRALTKALYDQSSDLFLFAEDYTLFLVGSWNAEDGCLVPCQPRSVCGAWTLKAALKANGGSDAR